MSDDDFVTESRCKERCDNIKATSKAADKNLKEWLQNLVPGIILGYLSVFITDQHVRLWKQFIDRYSPLNQRLIQV